MEKNCETCGNKIFCYKNFKHCMGFQPKPISTSTVLTKEQLDRIFYAGVNSGKRRVTLNLPEQEIYLVEQDAHTRHQIAERLEEWMTEEAGSMYRHDENMREFIAELKE